MPSRPPRLGSFRVRLELGLAAFAPALGLLAFRIRSHAIAWLPAAAAIIGVVVLLYGARRVAKGNPDPITFGDIEDLGNDILGHIGAYLVPIVIDTTASTEEIVISVVVLALIIQIHVVTGRVYVNPLLYLVGYRIYEANVSTRVSQGTQGSASYYLIARSDVAEWGNAPQHCVSLSASVLVERAKVERAKTGRS